MNIIRKGQVQELVKGGIKGQMKFIASIFE